jgi:hypothetical protein
VCFPETDIVQVNVSERDYRLLKIHRVTKQSFV